MHIGTICANAKKGQNLNICIVDQWGLGLPLLHLDPFNLTKVDRESCYSKEKFAKSSFDVHQADV